ncbi:PREDICTED: MIF4G domain-containing protein isoform X4 [Mandrillus leucophaeus]|uniref:MIF4G domain-containing protein isoform X4 n=1 Tax=Mandrillus leucophaeus TaxID=9568 RepID=UPI0005F45B12|nr:PREDICTED: MIF4G domain-containing protein isoform X4 [Mandrillus leucophaeus]
MGEPSREEYKIQSFDAETQQLLKTALKAACFETGGEYSFCQRSYSNCPRLMPSRCNTQDRNPGAVDLEKVANVIVDHSLQDCVFSKEAGRMCYAIIQVNNMPMMALVNPVYDCLFRLAQPDSLSKEEEVGGPSPGTSTEGYGMDSLAQPSVSSLLMEVDCLVLQLHRVGEQLEKMNGQRMDELFVLIRDGFLLPTGLSSLAQLLLLEIIEFRAAGWKTTPAAHKYYYSEVSD